MIFRDVRTDDAVKAILTKETMNVEAPTGTKIKGVDMVAGNNEEIQLKRITIRGKVEVAANSTDDYARLVNHAHLWMWRGISIVPLVV